MAHYLDILIFLGMLALGFGFGTWIEKRHYRSIQKREQELNSLPAMATKILPDGHFQQQLVLGSVVVSVDYFKRFLATLRNLFGGRMISYETLIDRARREAVLRMKSMAQEKGAEMIFNVKLETSSISKGRNGAIGSVEVLAYGTALIPLQSKLQ